MRSCLQAAASAARAGAIGPGHGGLRARGGRGPPRSGGLGACSRRYGGRRRAPREAADPTSRRDRPGPGISWIADAAKHVHRPAPRRAQHAPARRGDARRGAAADPGRRGLGQDPRAHPPDRLPAAHGPGPRRRDPRHHVHQQGRAGDARAGRAAGRPRHPRDVGHDVPLRLRADAARRRPPARLHAPVHDLRRGRLAPGDQEVPRRPGRGRQALHPARDAVPDLRRQEQAALRRRVPRAGRLVLRADGRRRLRALRARAPPHERDGLRRPARRARSTSWSSSRRSATATPPTSARSSSTSTRTPTTPSTGGSSS